MGEILNILQQNDANVSVTISLSDLRHFAKDIAEEVAQRLQAASAPSDAELLNINEVRDMLGVTKPTLWRWDKMGYLPKVMVGNRIHYRRSDVQRIMNNKN